MRGHLRRSVHGNCRRAQRFDTRLPAATEPVETAQMRELVEATVAQGLHDAGVIADFGRLS